MTGPAVSASTSDPLALGKALDDAQRYLKDGNLALADLFAQDALGLDPANPDALMVLGEVAVRRGLRGHAVSFLKRALSGRQDDAVATVLLSRALALQEENRAGPSGGLLVIKAWGAGFWADVAHVLGGLLLAELTGRTPVTLWGPNSRYSDGAALDAFTLYFEPVSDLRPADLMRTESKSFFPSKWNHTNIFENNHLRWRGDGSRLPASSFLNRQEAIAVTDWSFSVPDLMEWIPEGHAFYRAKPKVIFQHLLRKYLRPSAAVRASLAALDQRSDLSNIELSLHIRGADKGKEVANLDEVNAFYFKALDSLYKGGRVLVVTDDDRLIPRVVERFGEKVIIPACERQSGDIAVHDRRDVDPVTIGIEAVRDVYAAARAPKFLGNGRSNFSAVIPLLMEKADQAYLIGKNCLFERGTSKYLLPDTLI